MQSNTTLYAQYQATLMGMMGLTWYVTKNTKTQKISTYQDRMQAGNELMPQSNITYPDTDKPKPIPLSHDDKPADNGRFNNAELANVTANQASHNRHQDNINQDSITQDGINQNNNSQNSNTQSNQSIAKAIPKPTTPQTVAQSATSQALPTDLPTGGKVVVSTDKFEWFGMAYRGFILLGDMDFVNTTTKGVWQSLSEKLASQSNNYPLELSFPMGDFDRFGQMAAMGFLIALGRQANDFLEKNHSDTAVRYLFLTPMRDGVLFDVNAPACPSLDDMARFKQAKLDFWQILHG